MPLQTAVAIVAAAILIILFFRILKAPFRLIFKLIVNTAAGFIALIIINFLGGFIGLSVGVNWINAVIVGIFGVPGAALILIIRWLTML